MKSQNSSGIDQVVSSRVSILGLFVYPPEGGKIKIHENVYELALEIHNALSSTG